MSEGELILIAGALLAAALAASLIAARLRMPALVLFLVTGMAVGSGGAGWIDFSDYDDARRLGIVALALILFEGGLHSSFAALRTVLRPALALATLGTAVTAAVAGLAATALFGLPLLDGLLLGSIVASTDGAAIFALLRGSALRTRLARTLEAEAGLNDPVAVLLVLGFIAWIQRPGYGALDMAWLFVRELGIGAVWGLAIGRLAVPALLRIRLPSVGLYPVASIATAALAYGGADTLHGSGFAAVYLAGVALGSAAIPGRRTIAAFHDGVAWVAQVVLFVALGLLVTPSEVGGSVGAATVLAVVLALVARPLAVWAATALDRFSTAERVVLAWAGLRGAVPIVLATFPVLAGIPGSGAFFGDVFVVVVLSTLVQGATFEPLARALGATAAQPLPPWPPAESAPLGVLGGEMLEHPVGAGELIVGRRVRDLGLPPYARVTAIMRGAEAIPPSGSSRVLAGDVLHLLAREEVVEHVLALSETWRDAAAAAPAVVTVRWREEHGDPRSPGTVLGLPVRERLRTRRDLPGALVVLEDGRHAVTGPVIAVGAEDSLRRYAQRRRRAAGAAERAWWSEVVAALER